MTKKTNILIILILTFLSSCKYAQILSNRNYPEFRIDKDIKYRLHFGKSECDWIDVAQGNCAVIEGNISCAFEDFSPIRRISLIRGNPCLEIEKDKSIWTLCNIYDPMEEWYLTYIIKEP